MQNNQWKVREDQLLTSSPFELYNSNIVLTTGNIKNGYGLVESSWYLWDIQSLEFYLCHSTWKVIDPVKTQWADHQIQGAETNGRSSPLVLIFFNKNWRNGMKASEVRLSYIWLEVKPLKLAWTNDVCPKKVVECHNNYENDTLEYGQKKET